MTPKQEKRHQQYLKYYSIKKNRDKTLNRVKEYAKKNRAKVIENSRLQRRSKKGKLMAIFNAQVQRSKKNRGHKKLHKVQYSMDFFLSRFLEDKTYIKLHENWVKSNYKKELSPSIDRIDHNKGYTEDNIQMVTWGENMKKGFSEKRFRKVSLNNKVIFKSLTEASKKTGVSISHIYYCAKNNHKTKNGDIWKFA